MSTKAETKIADRLNGNSEDFIREAETFGLLDAIKTFHLGDLDFNDLYDWAQSKTKVKLMSQRGIFHNPGDSRLTLAEDLVTEFIYQITWRDKRIAELEEELAQMHRRWEVQRAQGNLREAIQKFAEVSNGNKH